MKKLLVLALLLSVTSFAQVILKHKGGGGGGGTPVTYGQTTTSGTSDDGSGYPDYAFTVPFTTASGSNTCTKISVYSLAGSTSGGAGQDYEMAVYADSGTGPTGARLCDSGLVSTSTSGLPKWQDNTISCTLTGSTNYRIAVAFHAGDLKFIRNTVTGVYYRALGVLPMPDPWSGAVTNNDAFGISATISCTH